MTRIARRLALAVLVLLAALPAQAGARANRSTACDVAVFMLGRLEGDKPKVFRGPPDRLYRRVSLWPKDPPSEAMAQTYLAAQDEPLLSACPRFKAALARRGIRRNPNADGVWTPDGDYRETLLLMALPVVSPDGLEAMVQADQIPAAEAGAGVIYHLRRQPGGPWRITDAANVWLS